jgi:Ca2+-binding EF-hand superfamily protein
MIRKRDLIDRGYGSNGTARVKVPSAPPSKERQNANRPMNIARTLKENRNLDEIKDDSDDLDPAVERVLKKIRNDIRSSHKRIMDIFLDADEDGSGTLDREEIKHALSRIGCHLLSIELEHLMRFLDEDGDGEIDYQEFSHKLNQSDKVRQEEIRKRLGPSEKEKFQMRLKHLQDTSDDRICEYANAIREKNVNRRVQHKSITISFGKEAIRSIRQFMRKYKLRTIDIVRNLDKNKDGMLDTNEIYAAVQKLGADIPRPAIRLFVNSISKTRGKLTCGMLYDALYAADDSFQSSMANRMPVKSREKHVSSGSSLPSIATANDIKSREGRETPESKAFDPQQSRLANFRSPTPAQSIQDLDEEITSLRSELESLEIREGKLDVKSQTNAPIDGTVAVTKSWRSSTDQKELNDIFLNEIAECEKLLLHMKNRKKSERNSWQTYWNDVGDELARKVQNAWRAKCARDIVRRAKRDRAAISIQNMYRMRVAKHELQVRRSVLKIQKVYRGHVSRVQTAIRVERETQAVIVVQKCARRILARNKAKLLREKRDRRMRHIYLQHTHRLSSLVIQRTYREYRKRMRGYRFRVVVQAARARKIEETTRRFEEGDYDEAKIAGIIGMDGKLNLAGDRVSKRTTISMGKVLKAEKKGRRQTTMK